VLPKVVKCREGYDTAHECERREGEVGKEFLERGENRCDVANGVDPLVLISPWVSKPLFD
jgi:hypothetical protein